MTHPDLTSAQVIAATPSGGSSYGEPLVSRSAHTRATFRPTPHCAIDWPLLRSFLSPAELCTLLPGRLSQNRFETVPLLQRCGAEVWRSDDPRSEADEIMANIMTEMIDLAVDTGTDAWTQDGWYCIDCVRELLKQRLWKWWYTKKQESGHMFHSRTDSSLTCLDILPTLAGVSEQVNCWCVLLP